MYIVLSYILNLSYSKQYLSKEIAGSTYRSMPDKRTNFCLERYFL